MAKEEQKENEGKCYHEHWSGDKIPLVPILRTDKFMVCYCHMCDETVLVPFYELM